MKKLMMFLLIVILVVSCAKKGPPKVLLFIRDGSSDLEYMLEKEALVMKKVIEQSGFKVVVSTLSAKPLEAGSIFIKPDLKLCDVNTEDYEGFIMPCMAAGPYETPDEAVAMVKKALKEGKPVAAQFLAVAILAKAGVLKGKKYGLFLDIDVEKFPDFKGGLYSGQGVVQDGNIITAGVCPFMGRKRNMADTTWELSKTLVKAINAKTK